MPALVKRSVAVMKLIFVPKCCMKFSSLGSCTTMQDFIFQCHVAYTVLAYCSHYNTVSCLNLVCMHQLANCPCNMGPIYAYTQCDLSAAWVTWNSPIIIIIIIRLQDYPMHIHIMWPLHARQQVPWCTCKLTFYQLADIIIINTFSSSLAFDSNFFFT